jgi:hypothetical protein
VNRAARRASRRVLVEICAPPVLALEEAFALNRSFPLPGLEKMLLEIRADLGPDISVEICVDCHTVIPVTFE